MNDPTDSDNVTPLHPIRPHEQIDPDPLEALRAIFPAWHIMPAAFKGYRAEWKSESGVMIRYVGGESIADLHRRLQVIEDARGDSE